MPTYQYKKEDGSVFEIMQRISESPLTVCPETGQKVKRLITGGAGVVYKGDGWYITDYKNKKSEPAATYPSSNDSEPKEAATTTPATKTEPSTPAE